MSSTILSINPSSLNFDANWKEGSTNSHKTFEVLVDGKSCSNGFRYSMGNYNWVSILSNNGHFEVIVNENFSTEERVATILFQSENNNSNSSNAELTITQKAIETSISTDYDGFKWKSVSNLGKLEERIVNVTCKGGEEDFTIQSYREYDKDGNMIDNDKGISIVKQGKNKLILRSFGRVFLPNGQYYVIVIAHINDPSKTVELRIEYDDYMPKEKI